MTIQSGKNKKKRQKKSFTFSPHCVECVKINCADLVEEYMAPLGMRPVPLQVGQVSLCAVPSMAPYDGGYCIKLLTLSTVRLKAGCSTAAVTISEEGDSWCVYLRPSLYSDIPQIGFPQT